MRALVAAAAAGLVLMVSCPVAAAEEAAPGDGVPAQLGRIDATLDEIVALLRRQVEQQDMALAMKRVELATFLLVDMRRSIDVRQDERDVLEEMARMEEEQLRDMSEALRSEGLEAESEEGRQHRARLDQMAEELARTRDRMKKLDLVLVDLENQSASQRDEIQAWQERVDAYFKRPR